MQVENTKHTYANVLSSCPEGPVDSGMIYLHSMASQWITDDLKKDNSIFSLPSVCLASGYRSTTTLLVSNVVLLREWSVCGWKTKVLAISPSIPSSVRFDGSRITPCKAIALLIQEIEQDVKLQSRGTTVDSVLTHTFRWTLKIMGFHGVWVPKEEALMDHKMY